MEDKFPKLELIDLALKYPISSKGRKSMESFLTAVDFVGDAHGPPIRINRGECTVLLGPSGCGKTSLLKMIAGLIGPTQGQILKDGIPITGPGADRSMVFQSYTSFPWLTVEENVLFGLKLKSQKLKLQRLVQKENRENALKIIELVGLENSIYKYPRELSGGMKQRVAIARALVNKPDILLMDEPFGALDPHIRNQMQELMLKIESELSATTLFVTHDAREAVFLGDVIYMSTPCPCFFKYRIRHPFLKKKMSREQVKRNYRKDLHLFQRDIEDRMEYLIENPDAPRIIEGSDRMIFKRSVFSFFEDL